MKQSLLSSNLWPFLCIILFTAFCNSQISDDNSSKNEETTSQIQAEDILHDNTPAQRDSTLQFSVMVTEIFEDSKGNFWFGSHGDGLCRYDGKQYTYFRANQGLPAGSDRKFAPGLDWSKERQINGGDQIASIQEDTDGNLWVKTMDHICTFDGQKFNIVEIEEGGSLPLNFSNTEWRSALEFLWFGSPDKLAVVLYDGLKLTSYDLPIDDLTRRDGVSEIYKDRDGNVWIGTMDNGTFRFDGKSFTRINKANEIGICRSAFQDKSGRIWITNNRFSLNYFEENKLAKFNDEYQSINPADPNIDEFGSGIQTIEQDANGDLWFGTFGDGLWRYDGKKLVHYTENPNDKELSVLLTKTIFKDNRGKLWFGIGEGSVYGFDGVKFERFDNIL